MKTFQREAVADVIEEIKPLLREHWREIAHFKDVPLNPDYLAYLAAGERCRVYTVREKGVLVGYAVFFIGSLHYQHPTATQDILFILPQHRGRTGIRFIDFCDAQLKAEGIDIVYQHVKVAHDFGPLLRRLGYEEIDHIYARRLRWAQPDQ